MLLILGSFCRAQSVSFDGQYHPGEPVPLRIDSPGAGLVQIRGEGVLGVDWEAPVKTWVTVPWMIWRTAPGEITITVNGKPQTLVLRPLAPGQAPDTSNPYAQPPKVLGPRFATYNPDVYLPADAWDRGQTYSIRFLIPVTALLTILLLTALQLFLSQTRILPWLVLAGGAALALFFPTREQLADPETHIIVDVVSEQQTDHWTYIATRAPDARVGAFGTFIPRSSEHLRQADPVLHIAPDGNPRGLTLNAPLNSPAAILQRSFLGGGPSSDPNAIHAPEFVRRVYQVPFELVDQSDPFTRLKPRE